MRVPRARADRARSVAGSLGAARRHLGLFVRRLSHAGGRFECPVCEARVRAFVPLEPEFRDRLDRAGFPHSLDDFETLNVAAYRCPVCREPDRSRLYSLYLRDRLARRAAGEATTFLDLAPSPELARRIRRHPRVRYVSADLAMPGVDLRASLTDLPLRTSSVDAFVCSHVLEHVPREARALAELHRVLRPGGWGIVMVPVLLTLDRTVEAPETASEAERWRLVGQGDHARLHSRGDLLRALREAAFQVRAVGAEAFGADRLARCGISPRSVLYVVEKPAR